MESKTRLKKTLTRIRTLVSGYTQRITQIFTQIGQNHLCFCINCISFDEQMNYAKNDRSEKD